jgi:hypothetical protein
MDPSYLFLPLGVVFGLVASYFDIKKRKTPNFLIMPTLIGASIIHGLLLIFSLLNVVFFPIELYCEFFLSLLYSILLVYFLWNLRLISAGDAKIFIVFFFLMLPTIFNFNHVRNFYHVSFLQNALLIALCYLIPFILTSTSFSQMGLRFKKILHWRTLLTVILFVYAFSYLSNYLMRLLGINSPTLFLSVIFIFLLLQISRWLFKKYIIVFILSVCALRLFLEFNQALSFRYWQNTVFLAVLILLFRFFFMYLGYNVFTREVKLEDLKPGMMLAEKIAFKRNSKEVQFIKTQDYKRTLIEVMDDSVAPELKAFQDEFSYDPKTGLGKETIEKLIKWRERGHLNYDSFLIFDSFAFAPYIFVAFLLTFVFQGDLITSNLVHILH